MKKSITVIFFFSFISYCTTAIAQACDTLPYQHIFYNQNFHDTYIKSFFFTAGSDICMIGYVNQDTSASNTDGWLMRTTFHGTPLWSKAIGTPAQERINSVKSTKDKGFMFLGSTTYNAPYEYGWLAKVDSNGTPQWSFELTPLNGTLFNVEEMDNGDFVVDGSLYLQLSQDHSSNVTGIDKSTNFLMRIDKNGNPIWQRSFYHTDRDQLNKIQQISDGNLVLTGNNVTDLTSYILKVDQYTGNIIWMNQYANPDDAHSSRIIENADGSFRFTIGNRTYYLTPDGKYESGAVQINVVLNNVVLKNTEVSDMGPSSADEIYFANIKPNPVVFAVENNAIITWAHIYNKNNPDELDLGSGRIFRKNIYLAGSYKANKISDDLPDEQMAYLLKASADGTTYCSDNFKIDFRVTPIATETDTTYSWTDEGSVTPKFISLYSNNIQPVRMLDCSQQVCCNDVAISKQSEICNNSFYTLPDSMHVTKPGFYTSRFTTAAGCDSIIYTNLTPQKNINFFLPTDTCLVNNMPVTFSLPIDTAVRYYWQDGTSGLSYTANIPGKYWVTAVSACSTITDSVQVHEDCAPTIFIPSAFTPNNDGLNDVFRIPDINNQHLVNWNIYNRFGQLIFHSDDPQRGWNGLSNNIPQPSGTYVYLLRYSDLAGKLHLLKGTVVLIR